MDYGRNVLGLGGIIGIVEPENAGSAKVLLKVGTAYEGKIQLGDKGTGLDLYVTRT